MLLATDDAFDGSSLTGEVFQRLGIDPDASRYLALPGRTPDGQNGRHGGCPMTKAYPLSCGLWIDHPAAQHRCGWNCVAVHQTDEAPKKKGTEIGAL
jgi:hypothetical protein